MFTYEQIQRLNELELNVYEYVIKHLNQVEQMKIRELAEASHVSTTTVLRFCQKVDCKGYSEFKVKLKMDNMRNQAPTISDEHLSIVNFFTQLNTKAFNEKLNECAKIIAERQSVIFFGVGSSGILGQYGARFFSNLGILATAIDDPSYPLPTNELCNTTLIVMSVSGETNIALHQANGYKKKQAKVISITNDEASTLGKISDGTIGYYLPIEVVSTYHNITTQVPVIYIIEELGKRVTKLI